MKKAASSDAPDLRIGVPQELAQQYGLSDGGRADAEARRDGILLRRAPAHLAKVYVEITARCNLACEMCVRNAWDEPLGQMPLDFFGRLIAQLADFPRPLTVMLACYGEPLSHPDVLAMVSMAKAAGLNVEITTNGLLLDRTMARALIELGLDRIWVSIDGVTAQRYGEIRRGGELNTVVHNLYELFAARVQMESHLPRLGLVFVAMKSNVAELPALHSLAARLRAKDLLITNVLAHTPEMLDEILYRRLLSLTPIRKSAPAPRVHLPRLDVAGSAVDAVVQLMRQAHDLSISGIEQDESSNSCPFVRDGATAIRWDGAVSPCPSLLHSHPEYGVDRWRQIRHAAFGNIGTEDLADIWRSEPYVRFREKISGFNFGPCVECGGCERADSNEEDCLGNELPVCGGCLWAQGFLRCP